MTQQQRNRRSTGGYGEADGMPSEPAGAVQMKQGLVGLSLDEQQERLRPQMPLQYSVQFQEENNERSNGKKTGRVFLITGSKEGSRIRIRPDEPPDRTANWAPW